jgi:GT2 family glycosyltransferase
MNKELPLISICIPLWEKDEHYEKLIRSIKEHDAGIPYEICVGEGHRSAAKNRNIAMRKAKGNYICQLDGDAEILQDGWLKKMYESLMREKEAGIIGCVVEHPTGEVDHPGTVLVDKEELVKKKIENHLSYEKTIPDAMKEFLKIRIGGFATVIPYKPNKDKIDGQVYEVFQCSGVCFLYDRRKVGEFIEIFEKAGWEDVDLMARVRAMGYNIYVDANVRIKHPNHIRSKDEEDLRHPKSNRGFHAMNLYNYMMRWGAM